MTDTLRLKIFNLTGALFNREPYTQDDLEKLDAGDEAANSDLVAYSQFLPSALGKAMRENNWAFLLHVITLEEDGGPRLGFQHSYTIPSEVLKIVTVGRNRPYYRVAGGIYLTDAHKPEVLAIYKDIDEEAEETVPEDFIALVAYALALVVFPKFGDTNIYSHLMGEYERLKTALIRSDNGMFHLAWE